jgi:hypothetical protein
MIDIAFIVLFAGLFWVFTDVSRAVLLFAACATTLNANLWSLNDFGGFSYVIDSAIYILSAHFVAGKYVAFWLMAASVYNYMTAIAETMLTSSYLLLSSDAIMILDLFYNNYEQVMFIISVCMLIVGLKSGFNTFMDDGQRRNTIVRCNFSREVY